MFSKNRFRAAALALTLLVSTMSLHAAATIIIVNRDGAGEGFNDPTPAAPVGGNNGTTLGQQRLNAFTFAANKWGATLTSAITIRVGASFDPLPCTSTSGTLGAAGPTALWRDFTGAPLAGHWYPQALANKISNTDLGSGRADITAQFNSKVGNAGCLDGTFFYLGLDNNHGTQLDLVTVLLHEFAHGLGFLTTTNGTTGAYTSGFPSVFDRYLFDATQNRVWDAMTSQQRRTSALNSRKLAWNGPIVTAAAPQVLQAGTPVAYVAFPQSLVNLYSVGPADFGPPLTTPALVKELILVTEADASGVACSPLSSQTAGRIAGKIALISRGGCAFTIKVKNAQVAGAVGVVIADNAAGTPPGGLSGTDPTITIPSVRVSQADGQRFTTALATQRILIALGLNPNQRSGADAQGRVLMYNPNPYSSGSSISHWDTLATPNLLMEPFITDDLTHNLQSPFDLTFELLRDIGWN